MVVFLANREAASAFESCAHFPSHTTVTRASQQHLFTSHLYKYIYIYGVWGRSRGPVHPSYVPAVAELTSVLPPAQRDLKSKQTSNLIPTHAPAAEHAHIKLHVFWHLSHACKTLIEEGLADPFPRALVCVALRQGWRRSESRAGRWRKPQISPQLFALTRTFCSFMFPPGWPQPCEHLRTLTQLPGDASV